MPATTKRPDDYLPTKADYDKQIPYQKGYWSYWFSEWPNSEIPENCPFALGTKEYLDFQRGVQAAVRDAQDMDD